MASRILLLSLAAASAASAPPPSAAASAPSSSAADPNRFAGSKPNVIILFADDFGWGDVGQNAPGVVFETAALDALAAGGAHFTDFHTFPLCTPSRGQLLTGRLPIRTGVTTNFVPESLAGLPTTELTIAELLKTAGYDTAQLGKWCVACLLARARARVRGRVCARARMRARTRAHARSLTLEHRAATFSLRRHLGTHPHHHPSFRGFDVTLTVPYSVDMGCMGPSGGPYYNPPQPSPCPTGPNTNPTASGPSGLALYNSNIFLATPAHGVCVRPRCA